MTQLNLRTWQFHNKYCCTVEWFHWADMEIGDPVSEVLMFLDRHIAVRADRQRTEEMKINWELVMKRHVEHWSGVVEE